MVNQESKRRTLLIVAGESSGDQRGAELVRHMKRMDPCLRFIGMGGDAMASAGVSLVEHVRDAGVAGFTEIIGSYFRLRRIFHHLVKVMEQHKPYAMIPIDFPDFNLRLCQEARNRSIPVLYYVSPQVWAWRPGRIRLIRRVVDRMYVFFKFEQDLYQHHGMEVSWTGHPLVETILQHRFRDDGLPQGDFMALLPGSREKEFVRHFPIMAATAGVLSVRYPRLTFVLAAGDNLSENMVHSYLKRTPVDITYLTGRHYDIMAGARVALVASGTATLECALIGVPMVVMYKVSMLTYAILKGLVRVDRIALPNIVMGRDLVPECIQGDATPTKLADEIERLLDDEAQKEMREDLSRLAEMLGGGGAAARAARDMLGFLRKKCAAA